MLWLGVFWAKHTKCISLVERNMNKSHTPSIHVPHYFHLFNKLNRGIWESLSLFDVRLQYLCGYYGWRFELQTPFAWDLIGLTGCQMKWWIFQEQTNRSGKFTKWGRWIGVIESICWLLTSNIAKERHWTPSALASSWTDWPIRKCCNSSHSTNYNYESRGLNDVSQR